MQAATHLPNYSVVHKHLPKDLPSHVIRIVIPPAQRVLRLVGDLQQQAAAASVQTTGGCISMPSLCLPTLLSMHVL